MSSKDVENVKEFKLVFLGTSGVGKTSLIDRFINEKFTSQLKSTVGMAFVVKTVRVGNISVKLNIWDTAGQERYLALTSSYMRNSDGAVVVYDIENETSFHRAQAWIRTLKVQSPPPKVIMLAANKSEPMKELAVEIAFVQKYAEENDILFMETSAKTALNVKKMFFVVAEQLAHGSETIQATEDKIALNDIQITKTKTKCCNS